MVRLLVRPRMEDHPGPSRFRPSTSRHWPVRQVRKGSRTVLRKLLSSWMIPVSNAEKIFVLVLSWFSGKLNLRSGGLNRAATSCRKIRPIVPERYFAPAETSKHCHGRTSFCSPLRRVRVHLAALPHGSFFESQSPMDCRPPSTSRSALMVQSRHPGRYPKLRSLTLSYPAFEPLTEHHASHTGLLTAAALAAAPALGKIRCCQCADESTTSQCGP